MKKTKRLVFLFKHKTKYVFLAALLSSIFIISCVKEGDFEFDKIVKNPFDVSWAAPFISSRMTLKDLLNDTSIIQVNSTDNSIFLVYNTKDLKSKYARDLFIIPDQTIYTDTTDVALPPIANGSSLFFSFTKPFSFDMPDPTKNQRLDSVYVKTATLNINITTNFNHKTKFVVSSPNIIKPDGQSFSEEIIIDYPRPAGSDTTQPVIQTINMDGFKIRFNNTSGHKNEVVLSYAHTIYGEGNANLASYHTKLNSFITDIKYDKLIGYIGQYSFPELDTTDLSLNANQYEGMFEFDKIEVGAKIYNSFGLPVSIKVDNFQAQNGSQNKWVYDFPATNPFSVDYPLINQIGQTITTIIPKTISSDLAQAMNISPKKLYFQITGNLNPVNNPAATNFVIDTSKFSVDINVNLPLKGKVGGFKYTDEKPFKMDNADNISEATFRINTWNAFPLNGKIQIYFVDSMYNALDSLVTDNQNIINAGVIDPVNYNVIAPTYKLSDYTLGRNRIIKIQKATKILIKAILYSPSYPAQIVKVTANDYLDVKLGMKIKLNTNLK
ncbi:MAG: hypothetical protein NTZ33_02750 [Bacteroidetes bacterium]|nr:hypothetical protein [Bacteroidota bacterium]